MVTVVRIRNETVKTNAVIPADLERDSNGNDAVLLVFYKLFALFQTIPPSILI